MSPGPSSAPSLMVEDAEAQRAAARSALYSLLSRCLAVPDEAFHASLTDGSLDRKIRDMAAALPYPLSVPGPTLAEIPGFIELQSGYIAFFEVGPKGPSCPLYEGSFRNDRGRKAVMEDLLRFYHHFGLKLSESVRELPDHLSAELEFMHYLSFLEAGIRARRAKGWKDLVLAQHDFLERHLAAWTPELARRAGKRGAPPFHGTMLEFLNAFVHADLDHLKETKEC